MAINIAFKLPSFYVRWRLLAESNNDVDVTLVGPRYSEYKHMGQPTIFEPERIEENRFRVIHINMNQPRWFKGTGWISWELFELVRIIKPDFIYLIGYEEQNVSFQMEIARKLFVPEAKIVCFTMRGTDYKLKHINPFKSIFLRTRIKLTSKIYDAMICHYPHGRKIIIEQRKFSKPVYIQTQIGVNKDIFKPDKEKRIEIRKRYGITGEFVFGTAGRIDSRKGVFDVIESLPDKGNWRLLILGDGKDYNLLKEKIKENRLNDYVITPGVITPGEDMASHLNAMDCFIHVPRTTKDWVDTFPLIVVQAMATALPIIGSNSGAVPYQLGGKGIIVPEGDIDALREKMVYIMNNPEISKTIGRNLFNRVMNTFEIRHLTKCFNIVMREILDDKYDEKYVDQTKFEFD